MKTKNKEFKQETALCSQRSAVSNLAQYLSVQQSKNSCVTQCRVELISSERFCAFIMLQDKSKNIWFTRERKQLPNQDVIFCFILLTCNFFEYLIDIFSYHISQKIDNRPNWDESILSS